MSDTTQPRTLERIRLALIRSSKNRNLGEALPPDTLWAEFCDKYNRILRAFAINSGCPQDSIDDIVYEVWCDVLKYLPKFEYDPARGRFRSWLYRITKSKAIDEARRLGRHPEICPDEPTTDFWQQIIDPQAVNHDDVLNTLYHQELIGSIMETFRENAPAKQQEVIHRFFFLGQDYEKVAREMGLEEENVRKLKQRALATIKVIAAEQFGCDPLS